MKQTQVLSCNEPIKGRRVCLQRLRADHADLLLRTFDNQRFWSAYRANHGFSTSRDDLVNRLEFEHKQMPGQVGKLEWLITTTPNRNSDASHPISQPDLPDQEAAIGLASLSAFNEAQKQAEFLIGFFNPDQIQTGVSVEASLLAMHHAFNQEGLHKLVSYVYADNARAQKSTLALGFRNEDLLLKRLRAGDGEHRDVYQNSLPINEFRNNQRLARLSKYLLGYDVTVEPTITSEREGFELSARFSLER